MPYVDNGASAEKREIGVESGSAEGRISLNGSASSK